MASFIADGKATDHYKAKAKIGLDALIQAIAESEDPNIGELSQVEILKIFKSLPRKNFGGNQTSVPMLGPGACRKFLRNNCLNRFRDPNHLMGMIADEERGHWVDDHIGQIVFFDSKLMNGQHTMLKIIADGKPLPCNIIVRSMPKGGYLKHLSAMQNQKGRSELGMARAYARTSVRAFLRLPLQAIFEYAEPVVDIRDFSSQNLEAAFERAEPAVYRIFKRCDANAELCS